MMTEGFPLSPQTQSRMQGVEQANVRRIAKNLEFAQP